jgi:hypothetical protein
MLRCSARPAESPRPIPAGVVVSSEAESCDGDPQPPAKFKCELDSIQNNKRYHRPYSPNRVGSMTYNIACCSVAVQRRVEGSVPTTRTRMDTARRVYQMVGGSHHVGDRDSY